MNAVVVSIEGAVYRCYPTQHEPSDANAKYIVAGVGSVTLMRATGAIVALAPIFMNGRHVLETLAPLLHAAA